MKVAEKTIAKAARSLTGRSGSDVAARKPAARKGSAGVKGSGGLTGAALAEMFIKQAMDAAEQVERIGKSLKEQLAELVLLDSEQHAAFRKGCRDKQASYAAEAVATGAENITKYRAQNSRVNYVYALLSDWLTLSEACELGWKPDMARNWNELKGAAIAHIDETKRKQAIANNATAKTLEAQKQAILKDTKLSVEKRQEEADKIDAQINEQIKAVFTPRARVSRRTAAAPAAATTTTTLPPVSGEAGANEARAKQIIGMLKEQPVPVLQFVLVEVQKYLDTPEWKERVAKHLSDMAEKNKREVPATPAARAANMGEAKPGNEQGEKKGEKAAAKGRAVRKGRK